MSHFPIGNLIKRDISWYYSEFSCSCHRSISSSVHCSYLISGKAVQLQYRIKLFFWRISLFFCQTRICNCNWYIIYKIISRRIWLVFSYPELTIWRIDSYKGTLIRSIVCQISSPVCSVSPSFAQFVSFMFLSGLRSFSISAFAIQL